LPVYGSIESLPVYDSIEHIEPVYYNIEFLVPGPESLVPVYYKAESLKSGDSFPLRQRIELGLAYILIFQIFNEMY
jgi:hypothetical protein